MLFRCDRARETLADVSARLVQFREMLLAWRASLTRLVRQRKYRFYARFTTRVNECCRMQDTAIFSRGLRPVTACSCLREELPPKLCKETRTPAVDEANWVMLARRCDLTTLIGRGRPARSASRSTSPVKGGQSPVGQQRLGDQQYNRRLPAFRRPWREIRARDRDSSR